MTSTVYTYCSLYFPVMGFCVPAYGTQVLKMRTYARTAYPYAPAISARREKICLREGSETIP